MYSPTNNNNNNQSDVLDEKHQLLILAIGRDEPSTFDRAKDFSNSLINHNDSNNSPHRTLLQEAIAHRCWDIVNKLFKNKHLNLDVIDSMGRTALHYAVKVGELELVKRLIQLGANVNVSDYKGFSPLRYAIDDEEIEICRCLIPHGATLDLNHFGGENGPMVFYELISELKIDVNGCGDDNNENKPLMLHQMVKQERHCPLVEMLFELGARVDVTDEKGLTPLHYAAIHNNIAAIHLLMEQNAVVDARCLLSKTPLWYAINEENVTTVERLLDYGALPSAENDQSERALDDFSAVLSRLFPEDPMAWDDAQDVYHQTSLHLAAKLGNEAIAKLLLQRNVKVDTPDNQGRTALFFAAEKGAEAIVKFLLDSGEAEIDRQDDRGDTALHVAAAEGHVEVCALLVMAGIDLSLVDHYFGSHPIHFAASHRCSKIVALMIDSKVDVNLMDVNHNTVLHEVADSNLGTPQAALECAEILIKHGAEVNKQNVNGRTALHHAIKHGAVDMTQLLLEKGADPNKQNHLQETALHVAAAQTSKASISIVKSLLKYQVNVSITDYLGQKAIDIARKKGAFEVVCLLASIETKQTIAKEAVILQTPLKRKLRPVTKIENRSSRQQYGNYATSHDNLSNLNLSEKITLPSSQNNNNSNATLPNLNNYRDSASSNYNPLLFNQEKLPPLLTTPLDRKGSGCAPSSTCVII